jgi:hypothetical protein
MELKALRLIESSMSWDDQTVIGKLRVDFLASDIKRAIVASTFRQVEQPP